MIHDRLPLILGILFTFLLSGTVPQTVVAEDEVTEPKSEAAEINTAESAFEAESPPTAEGCFPPCRDGYICHEAKCISMCNPPCDEGEKCTPEGDCISRQLPKEKEPTHQVSPATVEPEEPASADPVVEVSAEQDNGKDTSSLFNPGFILSLAVGPTLCGSSNGCRTFKNGDVGLGFNILFGYRILSWLVIDGGAAYSYMFLRELDEGSQEIKIARENLETNSILNIHMGARFYPLKRQRIVEPVLGIHLGYSGMTTRSSAITGDDGEKTEFKETLHGLGSDITAGVDLRASDKFSFGLHLTVYKPFYSTQCLDNLTPKCAKSNGDSNDFFFFGVELTSTFFL